MGFKDFDREIIYETPVSKMVAVTQEQKLLRVKFLKYIRKNNTDFQKCLITTADIWVMTLDSDYKPFSYVTPVD